MSHRQAPMPFPFFAFIIYLSIDTFDLSHQPPFPHLT